MFTNCGNMGLPLALLAFGPQGFGGAVALFSLSNVIHWPDRRVRAAAGGTGGGAAAGLGVDLEGMARAQLILFASLPPAVMQYLLAERYEQEPERVAAMILLGNAVALVFVPVGLALGL